MGTQLFLWWALLSWGLCCCRPTPGPGGSLQLHLLNIQLTFRNLKMAEDDYVTYVFDGKAPGGYRDGTWSLVEGIRLSNDRGDMAESSCSIAQYLDLHLPSIVRVGTRSRRLIVQNVAEFNHVFKQALNASRETPCRRRRFTLPKHRYKRKVLGLRILFSTREWLTHVTNSTEFS